MDALELRAHIERIKEGNERSFAVLVGEYEKSVRKFVFLLARPGQELDDVLQDVWLKVWRSIRTYRGDATFETWLYSVVSSVIADGLRFKHRRRRAAALVALTNKVDVADPRATDQFESVLDVRPLLAVLSMRQRLAIVLFDVLQLSTQEAANVVGISQEAFSSLVKRARASLKKRLEQVNDD